MSSETINKFTICLLVVVLIIMVLHFTLHPVRLLDMSTSIFYLDEKVTLAAYYTVVVAAVAGFIHLLVGLSDQLPSKFKINTLVMGVLLLLLSIDEYFEIHEYANTILKQLISPDTAFGQAALFSWIFPLSGFVLIIMAFFFKNILDEKNKLTRYFYISALVFFALAVPLELIGSKTYGEGVYLVLVGIEEGVEMFGVTFFLAASLRKLYSEEHLETTKPQKKIKKTARK